MQSFNFYSPTNIIFGVDAEKQTGAQAAACGAKRVLVVYGGQSAVKSGLIDRVCASLKEAGVEYETYGGVKPNPHLEFARAGVEKAKAFGAELILGVGGGSVIDTAKAIANGVANPDVDLWDFWLRKAELTRALPVGAVLTIPAAGSECSDSAVLTKDDTLEKRGLGSNWHRPRFAIMNPELTYSLPPYQVTCGIVDILMHTFDRYFNPVTTNELTDEIAEGLMRCTIKNGKRAVENQRDYQAMSELMWAGSLSHNGLTGLGCKNDFAPHQLGHELSAKFDAAHGATLSTVWGSWASYVVGENPARFAQFGEKVWGIDRANKGDEQTAAEAIEKTVEFFRWLKMPTSIPELVGSAQSDEVLEDLAHRCTFFGTRKIGSFKVLGHDDILAIYKQANR